MFQSQNPELITDFICRKIGSLYTGLAFFGAFLTFWKSFLR